jgi:predicted metalloprotease
VRRLILPFLALCALALPLASCGAADDLKSEARQRVADVKRTAEEIRRKAERLGADAKRLREQLARQVRDTLAQIQQVVPAASRPIPQRRAPTRLETFLAAVVRNVDGYWTQTLRGADLPAPHVRLVTLRAGERGATGCGAAADQSSAFYCPADDAIYLGEAFVEQILRGTGDFGVAYVVAHEYAHNVQQELGWYSAGRRLNTVKPFELQADCMAGAWGNSVYRAGQLDAGDVQEAQRTAYAVGDFDLANPQHHGTPEERLNAWQLGFERGDPAACRQFVPR